MTASGTAPAPHGAREAPAAPASVLRGGARVRADNRLCLLCAAWTDTPHSGHPDGPLADPAADPGCGEIVMGPNSIVCGRASTSLPAASGRAPAGSGRRPPACSRMARGCDVRSGAVASAGAVHGACAAARPGPCTMVNPRTRMGRLATAGLRGAVARDDPPPAPIRGGRSARTRRGGMPEAGIAEARRARGRAAAVGGSAPERTRAAAPLSGRCGGGGPRSAARMAPRMLPDGTRRNGKPSAPRRPDTGSLEMAQPCPEPAAAEREARRRRRGAT